MRFSSRCFCCASLSPLSSLFLLAPRCPCPPTLMSPPQKGIESGGQDNANALVSLFYSTLCTPRSFFLFSFVLFLVPTALFILLSTPTLTLFPFLSFPFFFLLSSFSSI